MIFVINNLKYDTDKMKLISEKCEYLYSDSLVPMINYYGKDVKLWKSAKNNWLLTYKKDLGTIVGKAITEREAKSLLKKYDLEVYETLFGELEEA